MALEEDLIVEVDKTFRSIWNEESTDTVPDPEDLLLNANHAKKLEAAVLYADLDGSTNMVDTLSWQQSAEVYKTYLRCASDIIRSESGAITAYDGDRVMAVYTGTAKNTTAVRTAMKINRAVTQIIRPAFKKQYAGSTFEIKHAVGVDTGTLMAARVGVRGDNDIVWVGRAANYAAKLCAVPNHPLWITERIYNNMHDGVKYIENPRRAMWSQYRWTGFNGSIIYGSEFWWNQL